MIATIDRIIAAIRKQVATYGAACIKNGVSADESSPFRIVISCVEVVEPGFGVVVITTVTEGVILPQGRSHGTGGGNDVAPCIVDF